MPSALLHGGGHLPRAVHEVDVLAFGAVRPFDDETGAAEAFGQFLEYKEQYYDVRYRDEQQYEPPQRFAEFFQQYVEVVDRNESLPEGTSHFFKGLAHKEQGDQRNYKAYHVFKNIYCYE